MNISRRNIRIIAIVAACIAVIAVVTVCEARRSHRMHEALELALEQNRSGIPFTSDTIVLATDTTQLIPLRRVVSYYKHPLRRFFSRHSSFNPQSSLVQSLYALGCVYRDLHEAPIALLTWEDAIAAADTTSADCDYATLFRVYGQMAEIYRNQHLPEKQLEANSCFCKYALLAGDTLFYLRGKLLCNSAYYTLGDSAAIFANSEAVRQQYLQFGLTQEAARVYPTPIQIAVEAAQYKRAHKMMDRYELESGLFGADGFITDSSRAQYHSYKGHYYLGIHEVDSAERQFRHILPIPSTAISAYRGLMAVYKEKRNIDSVQKYSSLFEAQAIDIMNQSNNTAIIQAEGMYDYTRQEGIAKKQAIKAGRLTYALTFIVFLLLIISIYTIRYHQKKEEEKADLVARYSKALDDLSRTKHEVQLFKKSISKDSSIKKLLKEKEELIAQLESTVRSLQEQIGLSQDIVQSRKVEESEIIQHFHLIAQHHCVNKNGTVQREKPRAATTEEWAKLVEAVQQYHPAFYLFIVNRKLSALKFKVSILSFLGFDNHEITILTNANKGSIPNARTALAKELFGLSSAHELDNHLRQIEPPS